MIQVFANHLIEYIIRIYIYIYIYVCMYVCQEVEVGSLTQETTLVNMFMS